MTTSNTEPRIVLIADLVLNSNYQMRSRTDVATVERYRQAYKADSELPPITVARVNGAACVVDGWHRVEAAKKLGRYEIAAVVIPATDQEARRMAMRANLQHGLPLKPGEYRKVFRTYVQTNDHIDARGRLRSYREIAADLGKPHTTIRNWMMKHFPSIARELGGEDTGGKKGGLMEPQGVSLADHATEHLKAALAAARGVDNPEERGALIALMKMALEEVEKGGKWETPNDDF